MPLAVGYDVTPLLAGRTGIALHAQHLADALGAAGIDLHRFAVGRAQIGAPPMTRHLPVPSRIVHWSWSHGGPPRAEWLIGPVDVVHATGLLPPTGRRPTVATVHDVAAVALPHLHPPRQVQQVNALLRSLRRCRVVTVVSHATARELEERGVPADRVVVTHPGLIPLALPLPARLVDGPFILLVGEQAPRKDLGTALRAFAAAKLEGLRIVHAGPPASGTASLRSLAHDLRLGDRFVELGYVDRAQLAGLLRDAHLLAFPSVAEGFGHPVLEAMASGTPVLAADIPTTAEVAGDAAAVAPAGDVDAWAAALADIVGDESRRAAMAGAGRLRAMRFTWQSCAAQTIQAYELAVGG